MTGIGIFFKNRPEGQGGTLKFGEMKRIPLGLDEKKGSPLTCNAILDPLRGFDVGNGKGGKVEKEISGGVTGIVLDGRGRPFHLPEDNKTRVTKLKEWMIALDIYPQENLERL